MRPTSIEVNIITVVTIITGLCIEEEPPSYDMDTEDEEWLNAQSRDRVSDVYFCDHKFVQMINLAIVAAAF